MPPPRVAVFLEIGLKSTFASALDWPGWCRGGRNEDEALEALGSYAQRYAQVAEQGGARLPDSLAFEVLERAPGGPMTAFAAPECRRPFPQVPAEADGGAVTEMAAGRLVSLVTAAWATFDHIVAASPAGLRKGPRGGGRDRDEIVDHVLAAETAYARKLGVRLKQPALHDTGAIEHLRAAIAAMLGATSDGSPVVSNGWTTRYAARRIAWHVLEHGWEMQDRSEKVDGPTLLV